ncbi:MAG: oligopeptidase B, partial [Gemmatimonadota bacterium]|nr:oligopeptidase B [Gemmatimonadota bacterium]
MRPIAFVAPLLSLIALPSIMSAQRPLPPIAKRLPVESVLHGERRVDEYAYFKDRNHPETIPYLEAENRYTDAMMAHTAGLQQQLYDEMLAKIK